MTELVAALQPLLGSLLSSLGIPDFSLLLSGAATLAAVLVATGWARLAGARPHLEITTFLACLACCIVGLVGFSLGRALCRILWGPVQLRRGREYREATEGGQSAGGRDKVLRALVRSLKLLAESPCQTCVGESVPMEVFYTRAWMDLRRDERLRPSCDLTTSCWVHAAILDGLVACTVVWAVVLARHPILGLSWGSGGYLVLAGPTLVFVGVLLWSAATAEHPRNLDLVCTLAWVRDRRQSERAARAPAPPEAVTEQGNQAQGPDRALDATP
ncbi:MAG: hypothetical protein ABIO70_36180 [Pseudomonadota bacterium]